MYLPRIFVKRYGILAQACDYLVFFSEMELNYCPFEGRLDWETSSYATVG